LKEGPQDIIRVLDSPFPDPDGFRLLWFHSTQKQERDAEGRQKSIDRAVEELQQLKAKVEAPRSRLTTREGIAQKVAAILEHQGAQRWIRYTLSWQPLLERIAEDALRDGVFPLLANCPDLSLKEVLEAYKRKQPLIEKRNEMPKTVLAATPVFLKNVACVEAFLFLEYVAMTVHALVEREVRQAMQRQRVKKLALYPEERECQAPTVARVFEVLGTLQRHVVSKGGKVAQVFLPEVTVLQRKTLKLLGVSVSRFRQELD
jgi:transposase